MAGLSKRMWRRTNRTDGLPGPGMGRRTDPAGAARSAAPRISVIMAAFNAAPFLAAAIDSLLAQTFPDFELIVIDNGSTDVTAAILGSYTDPRITVLRPGRNLGVVGARNLGFTSARGQYLAVHDADDISLQVRFARQVEYLDSHPDCVLVSSDIFRLHASGTLTRTDYRGAASPRLLDWMLFLGNPIAFSSTMMRTSALRALPEFLRQERCYAEDMDLYVRLRSHGFLARLTTPLLMYRVHPGGASVRHRHEMVSQTRSILLEQWGVKASDDEFLPQESYATAASVLAGDEGLLDADAFGRLRAALLRLQTEFLARLPDGSEPEIGAVQRYTGKVWEQIVCRTLYEQGMDALWWKAFAWPASRPGGATGRRGVALLRGMFKRLRR